MNRLVVSIVGVVALLGSACFVRGAEDSTDLTTLKSLSIDEIMQIKIPTVYGASKHEQKITDAPSSVTIVTRDDIQIYGHRTLADILRSVRDFYVSNDRNYGFAGVRGFNPSGDYGGRILTLVDGLRMNEPIYDGAGVVNDFVIDVDLIERVEIIRGPGSALYGNNAFFAVINVITRTGADVHGLEASSEAGSLNAYKARVTYGKVFKNDLSLLITGSIFDSAGNDRLYYKEFDQPMNNRGLAEGRDDESFRNAGLTINYKDFTFQSGYVSRRKDIPTASFGTIFNGPAFYTIDERSFTRLTYAHDFEDDLSVRADLHWNTYHYEGDYPYANDENQPQRATIIHDNTDEQWWGVELQLTKRFFKTHRATFGLEYRDNFQLDLESYDVEPHFDYIKLHTSSSTFGAYFQDEWAITQKLTLNAGLRYDWFEAFGGTINPRSALIWQPGEKTALKFLFGQAFRAPNVYESSFVAAAYRANPDLGPERIKSYEVVLERSLTPALRLSVSGFYNRIEDLIAEQTDPGTGLLFFDNVDQADTKGGSIELEAKLPKGIRSRASYTLQRTTNLTTGERVSNSPEHLAKLGLTVPIYKDKILNGLELQYSSEVRNGRNQPTNAYLLVNWTLFSRELVKNLDASLSVYNLFDKKYGFPGGPEHLQQTIQQDGRTFRLKLTYRY